MKNFLGYCLKYFLMFALSLTLHLGATSAATSNTQPVRLSGHVPDKAIAKATFLGNLEPSVQVPITFVLPLRDNEVLEDLIHRIYDPADQEHFGKYLTSEEFIKRFAPSQEDYDKVIAYAKSAGLAVTGIHPNRTLLNVSAPTKTIETTLNLRLNQYESPNGRKFHAPSNNPEVPTSIASIISGIVGLDNHPVWRPFNRRKYVIEESPKSSAAAKTSPSGFSPADIVAAYNLTGVSANGSGQVIALFELGKYQESDIKEYTKQFGLPAPKLKNILVDGGSGGGIDAEVTLDIELAIALAPKSEIYVYEGPNSNQGVLNTYNRIATDNIAKQISTSWGLGEDLNAQYLQAENAIFKQMAALGQTIYAAAGDSGAYDDFDVNSSLTLMVDDPASQPYVVGVGGTRLTVNPQNGAYGKESVWNDGLGVGAGGGGVSTFWPIPSWQINVPTAISKTHRNVPDVSLNADTNTGYAIYYDKEWTIYGGTSCAAPLWASFTALINQVLSANQKPALGFANPSLYAIGAGASYASSFYDITLGDNLHYSAGTGYDNATGWGSFNGANLLASLTNSSVQPPPPPPPPPQLSPLLNISMTHTPNSFSRRGTGVYTISVSNHGKGPTSGPVKVAISLPQNLKFISLNGSGWTINKNTLICTQTHPLQAGASYPPITLTVHVGRHASSPTTASATVSGGGSASSTIADPTVIK